jgi:hypothetical protein
MDQNQNNSNPNWGFSVNLAGLRAPTGAAKILPEGYYKATLTDAYVNNDKPTRVIFKLTISDGEFVGTVRTTGLNAPKSPTDNVRYYWRGMLESAGYTPAQIDAGEVGMNRALLVDRTVYFHYVPGDKEAGIYEEVNFLPPSDWTMKASSFAKAAASGGINGTASTTPSAVVVAQNNAVGSALSAALGGGGIASGPMVSVQAPSNGLGGVDASALMSALGARR